MSHGRRDLTSATYNRPQNSKPENAYKLQSLSAERRAPYVSRERDNKNARNE